MGHSNQTCPPSHSELATAVVTTVPLAGMAMATPMAVLLTPVTTVLAMVGMAPTVLGTAPTVLGTVLGTVPTVLAALAMATHMARQLMAGLILAMAMATHTGTKLLNSVGSTSTRPPSI